MMSFINKLGPINVPKGLGSKSTESAQKSSYYRSTSLSASCAADGTDATVLLAVICMSLCIEMS